MRIQQLESPQWSIGGNNKLFDFPGAAVSNGGDWGVGLGLNPSFGFLAQQ